MTPDELRSRYRGCLLGLACGDALGGPAEFMSREDVARAHPGGLRDFTGGGWLALEPGEITDDTQMTLALARSLAAGGPLDMVDVAARFLAWYQSKPKDVGNTTAAALRELERGRPWTEAGAIALRHSPHGAAGNGAVMRCAPVALRFRRDPAALRSASIDTARVTHADPRCVEAAVAVNQALALLLDGATLGEATAGAIHGVENAELRAAIEGAALRSRDDVRSGGYVIDTTGAAFWALHHHDTAEEAIVAAVMLGGDTDTTGAVAGALAGARYGVESLPTRWIDRLQPAAELVQLADRLLELSLTG